MFIRTNSGMEDSSTMTVEFLRARLLSERDVSRSARQRVDELAKRVCLMYFLHSVELTFFDLLSEELLSLSLSRSVCYPEMLVMFIN